MIRALPVTPTFRLTRLDLAIAFYGVMVSVLAQDPWHTGSSWGALALPTIPLAVLLRRRPYLAAAAIIVGSLILRLAFFGVGEGDQLAVGRAAADVAFAGGNPYGIGYAVTTPPGSPYPYGPLGLIWWLPGRLMEILGALGMMAVLAHQRAWLTLAIVAAWPFMIYMTTSGINDYSAAGVLVGSLVLMRTHPRLGMAGLAVAVALKPYAIAWAVSAIGFAGGAAFAMFAGVSLLLWAPVLLWWGPSSYLASVLAAEALHERVAAINAGGGSINFPEGRWIAVPIALAGRRFSSWRAMVLLGSGAFAAFLFLSPWTSGGYWVVLLPVVGLALEATRQGRAGQAPGSVLATADGGGPKQPPWWADLPWEPHGNSRKATTPPRPA